MTLKAALEQLIDGKIEPGVHTIETDRVSFAAKIFSVPGLTYVRPDLYVDPKITAYDLEVVKRKAQYALAAIYTRDEPSEFSSKYFPGLLEGENISECLVDGKIYFFDFFGVKRIRWHVTQMIIGQMPINYFFGPHSQAYAGEFAFGAGRPYASKKGWVIERKQNLKLAVEVAHADFLIHGKGVVENAPASDLGNVRAYISLYFRGDCKAVFEKGKIVLKKKEETFFAKIKKAISSISDLVPEVSISHENRVLYLRSSISTHFPGFSVKISGDFAIITRKTEKQKTANVKKGLNAKNKAMLDNLFLAVSDRKIVDGCFPSMAVDLPITSRKAVLEYLSLTHPKAELLWTNSKLFITIKA